MIAMAKTHFSAFSNRNLIANRASEEGAISKGSWIARIAIHETWHKFIDLQNEYIYGTPFDPYLDLWHIVK